MKSEVQLKQRILFADTDAGGMMYFGQAARWIEAGIHDWFRQNNLTFLDRKDLNLFWVIREIRSLYSKPIFFDEEITISCKIRIVQRFSITFDINIIDTNGEKKISSFARLVPIDKTSQKTVKIPDELYQNRQMTDIKKEVV